MQVINKGTEVTVTNIIGNTAADLCTQQGTDKYVFTCTAYVDGETLDNHDDVFINLWQAREVIPGKRLGDSSKAKKWHRLTKALFLSGVKPINISGAKSPIIYTDERAVKYQGSLYFVVKIQDIDGYLKLVPLDEKGKANARKFAQTHPRTIANQIGQALWDSCKNQTNVEFIKITMIPDYGTSFSIMYPTKRTNLIWPSDSPEIPKVVCSASEETGIDYLSGYTAGRLDPRKHGRIRMFSKHTAYLMPNPQLADQVREVMFSEGFYKGIVNDLVSASTIIVEEYDLNDNLLRTRFVYDRASKSVKEEHLISDLQTGESTWIAKS